MTSPLASLRARVDAEKARRSDSGIPFCPHKPTERQAAFLRIDTLEALYGGAAGGGKSDALLMAALQYADRPGYSALVLRRTFPELNKTGAIMDRARTWLANAPGVTWSGDDKRFTFPKGGRLSFGYCETHADVLQYQGPEFHYIAIDEVTHWEERTYTYLITRLRRNVGDTIPLRIRGATNPGGKGHKWVKKRFVSPGHPSRPFVPAKLADNPHLSSEEYGANLELLDETTRAQLRDGQWIDNDAGLLYKWRADRNGVEDLPELAGWRAVVSVDLGSSEIKPTTAFTICLWHEHDPRTFVIRSWAEAGLIPATIAERIRMCLDLFPEARVVMDIGALGSGYASEMRSRYSLPVEAAEKRDKLGFRKMLNGALERGEVLLLRPECPMLIDEMETLIWNPLGTDHEPGQANHCTDSLLYGWRMAQSWRSAYHKPEPKLSEEERLEKIARSRYDARRSNPDADW